MLLWLWGAGDYLFHPEWYYDAFSAIPADAQGNRVVLRIKVLGCTQGLILCYILSSLPACVLGPTIMDRVNFSIKKDLLCAIFGCLICTYSNFFPLLLKILLWKLSALVFAFGAKK